MQPFSQVLEEYSEMATLQRSFKDLLLVPENQTVQMFFRIGKASPTARTPRRDVRSFFRRTPIGNKRDTTS